MLSLAHTLISLPIGIYFQNPFLIFLAAFILHLLSDTFLHWNIYPHHFRRYPFGLVGLEVGTGLVLAWFFVGDLFLTLPILAAIAGGNAPDVLHAGWSVLSDEQRRRWFRPLIPLFRFHEAIQQETEHIPRGLVSQGIAIAVAFVLIRWGLILYP